MRTSLSEDRSVIMSFWTWKTRGSEDDNTSLIYEYPLDPQVEPEDYKKAIILVILSTLSFRTRYGIQIKRWGKGKSLPYDLNSKNKLKNIKNKEPK